MRRSSVSRRRHLKLDGRVTCATIALQVAEQQRSSLDFGPLPLSARMRNAAVDGVRTAFASAADALLLLLGVGPVIALWASVAGAAAVVVRRVRQRLRPRVAPSMP